MESGGVGCCQADGGRYPQTFMLAPQRPVGDVTVAPPTLLSSTWGNVFPDRCTTQIHDGCFICLQQLQHSSPSCLHLLLPAHHCSSLYSPAVMFSWFQWETQGHIKYSLHAQFCGSLTGSCCSTGPLHFFKQSTRLSSVENKNVPPFLQWLFPLVLQFIQFMFSSSEEPHSTRTHLVSVLIIISVTKKTLHSPASDLSSRWRPSRKQNCRRRYSSEMVVIRKTKS